jgi:hypothetical protein
MVTVTTGTGVGVVVIVTGGTVGVTGTVVSGIVGVTGTVVDGGIVGVTGTVVGGTVGVRVTRGVMGFSTSPESLWVLRRCVGVTLTGVSGVREPDCVGVAVMLINLSEDVSGAAVAVTDTAIITAVTIAKPASNKESRSNRFFIITIHEIWLIHYAVQCFLFFWENYKIYNVKKNLKIFNISGFGGGLSP